MFCLGYVMLQRLKQENIRQLTRITNQVRFLTLSPWLQAIFTSGSIESKLCQKVHLLSQELFFLLLAVYLKRENALKKLCPL